ncbi:unnamed protein product [Ranitomeya imitator]|uniref:Protein-arginine deiminase C-terminal domain-containing protein n=1 Tax=Ranitomeya imitator TaxID=111125 RepID=A0ABN9LTC4_9NEOB|nr:unnamed protein product [Ranitomeya imitator]
MNVKTNSGFIKLLSDFVESDALPPDQGDVQREPQGTSGGYRARLWILTREPGNCNTVNTLDSSPEIWKSVPAAVITRKDVDRATRWVYPQDPLLSDTVSSHATDVKTNSGFIKLLSDFVEKTRCPLTKVTYSENRGDQWIQDEMEFGYTEAPHKRFPVVLDSPRNRGLKNFPVSEVLGPDFGYVTREPGNRNTVNTLDSFGNLEVSPPVTAGGKSYPLGRILIGDSLHMGNMRMSQVVRDFLGAQQVQPPVFLFSTWLYVGHIDEFMSFVPAPDRKGFRLLLASPRSCLQVLTQKQKEGHGGGAVMFEGLGTTEYTIDDILADETLKQSSETCQESIDLNRKIMKKELGLSEDDIIDIPMLYKCDSSMECAESFFPNMVNMLVLGKYLGIPKPFGPPNLWLLLPGGEGAVLAGAPGTALHLP